MKKVFGQTVRDIKREVNKKVLKVPGIEQKVLDATSNEPWGPHGSYLADIAQATRNYNEYQMIMVVLWKRINDTGKNWRHVYKALIVLEYLVGHGSERVIDDIREHAYQISTLSDFQYVDSGGRDQGNNVRKKSQSLVALVNDKEKIQEFRQKALANRDKYRGPSSTGGMYRPSPYSSTGGGYGDRHDDDRYEGRYGEDRNGYNRERDWGSRDDDRYSHGGDRYSKDYDERYGRDGYRDDDFKGSRGSDDYGSRNRGYDRERDRSYDDDDRYSSRSAGGRVEEMSPDDRRFERKLSQQSIGAPPSYEEAVNGTPSQISDERNGPMAPNASSPPPPNISSSSATSPPAPKASSPSRTPAVAAAEVISSEDKEVETFDEFDPRSSIPAAPSAASSAETDIFGLADINALALMPVPTVATTSEVASASTSGFESNFVPLSSASSVLSQPSENPFGDSPFKALPSHDNFNIQGQSFASLHSNATASNPSMPTQPTSLPANPNFEFSDTFPGISYGAPSIHGAQAPASTTSPFPPSQSGDDILGGILPQPGVSATMYPAPAPSYHLNPTSLPPAPVAHYGAVTPFGSPAPASVSSGTFEASHAAPLPATTGQVGSVFSVASPAPIPTPAQSSHLGYTAPLNSQIPPAPAASTAPAPSGSYAVAQQQKDKFEPKSAVWADTLNRGLVNLNISGSKINPLADIGVDFDAINRKEKRTQKEKSSANPVTSTITMGKAMGSGSGIGRAGASGITQPPNPTMGGGSGMGMAGGRGMPMGMGMGMGTGMGMSGGPGMGMGMGGSPGMNMGMGMGMGTGMGMGSYGGMNQPMGGMGFNMGMGQGAQMRPPSGPGMPGGYNPMLGTGGGYGSQQPYGGYR